MSQLVAYGSSTFSVLQALYKDLSKDAAAWTEYETELALLLHIIESITKHVPNDPAAYPEALLALLLDLTEAAQTGRQVAQSAQKTGFLGIRWASIPATQELERLFKRIRAKREILQLYIGQDSLNVARSTKENTVAIMGSPLSVSALNDQRV